MFAEPTWYDLNPARWAHEVVEVHRRFPYAKWGERIKPFRHLFWRVRLCPYENRGDAGRIAAHLLSRTPLDIGVQGELLPTSDLQAQSPGEDWTLGSSFLVELVYLPPPNIPVVYGLYERIDRDTFPCHPHLTEVPHPLRTRTGFGPRQSLCTFAPHHGLWAWETGTARELLEFAALFLGSHEWWVESGQQVWLTPGASHDLRVILRTVKPTAPCPGGHGKSFGKCCRPLYLGLARAA